MYLVEEQSTWSPNMPLRGLIYYSGLYQGYVEKCQLDVYSRVRVSLPRPVYIVFYIDLIYRIRAYSAQGCSIEEAIDCAVKECIHKNVLKEFLLKHRGEVCNVILTHYDEKLHIRSEKALSFAEGRQEGRKEGRQEGMYKVLDNYLAQNPSLSVDVAARILGFNEKELQMYIQNHNCAMSLV